MGKNRLGRNELCHCSSGKKYKHCHLNQDEVARRAGGSPRVSGKRQRPGTLVPEVVRTALRRHVAQEAVRKSEQGEGKPIISLEFKDHRFVAVGNTLYWSPKNTTQTFADFLNIYIKRVFEPGWGNTELRKPLEERHPIMQWYHEVATLQQEYATRSGEKFSTPKTGAVAAYINLAYNLYLLGHNATVQRHLLERLKHSDSFHSAYYETYVAAWFILAGFELELENEKDTTVSHCEFTATSPAGMKFSVEAKARQPNKDHLAIGNQLSKALRKAANHRRVVFIDMNLPMTTDFSKERFMDPISDRIRKKEDMTINGEPAPAAYVVITNMPFHLHIKEDGPMPQAILGEGFKIPDFGSVSFTSFIEAYKAHEKHADIRRVIDAAVGYRIPETFDGELPEFADGKAQRLRLGESYRFDDGRVGTLRQGFVLESSQELIMVVDIDGQQLMYRGKLSDDEIAAYRRHPETFFGEISHVTSQKEAKTPFDLFLFFHGTYKNSKREKLLEFLSEAQDIEVLQELPTEELALIYCDRITRSIVSNSSSRSGSTPLG